MTQTTYLFKPSEPSNNALIICDIYALARQEGEALGFHWDRDEYHADNTGIQLCPLVATVTYLSDYGSPTVVLPQTPLSLTDIPNNSSNPGSSNPGNNKKKKKRKKKNNNNNNINVRIGKSVICYPVKYKHIAFSGQCL